MEVTRRLSLNLGTHCNQQCKFCYYSKVLNRVHRSSRELKKRLSVYRKYGINKLHLTGGEPLLHDAIKDIVLFAKKTGFEHISVITNGTLLTSDIFEDLKSSGVDEFIVSLHGAKALTHDTLVGLRGFDKTLSAIGMLFQRGFPFSINFVVNEDNYREMPEFVRLVARYRPRLVTFLYFNPEEDASVGSGGKLFDAAPTAVYLEEAAKALDHAGLAWDYKFVPMCIVPQYIKHAKNQPQAIHDFEEWDWRAMLLLSPFGRLKYTYLLLRWYKYFSREQIDNVAPEILAYLCALRAKHYRDFVLSEKCRACCYRYICFGARKQYLAAFGDQTLRPQAGEAVVYPVLHCAAAEAITDRDRRKNKFLYALSKKIRII